ncbi:endoribonuclease L-PSP [Skermanella stibiiresistens SB22]|uniref:Endoribonuclease L-PSP n=1 Tax=Skermanella stibiiresistens SB22 TaxID=1385369 RepID=W9H7R1_9PROT|nr:RidA family protein [Skermanella stibiiresistens]EWY42084.1 endoribonuclease L-PSP [Skermanella stibiiresistens SB22]
MDRSQSFSHHDVPEIGKPLSPYSHVVSDGLYAFLAGQLAFHPDRGAVVPGTIEEECAQAMDLLGMALRSIGLEFSDVVKVTIHMTDLTMLGRMNAVYARYFDPDRLPARTCTGAASLIGGGQIEIDCVARLRT